MTKECFGSGPLDAEEYESFLGSLGSEQPFLLELRRKAFESFARQGLPSKKDESWKYTDPSEFVGADFFSGGTESLDESELKRAIDHCVSEINSENLVVLVNGVFSAKFSRLKNTEFLAESLRDAFKFHEKTLKRFFSMAANVVSEPFLALNRALFVDGLFALVPRREKAVSLHLVNVSSSNAKNKMFFPRMLVIAESGAELKLVESHIGIGGHEYCSNLVSEIFLGESSRVFHTRIVDEATNGKHLAQIKVRQDAKSTYELNQLCLGGRLVRSDIAGALLGDGAFCSLNGLDLACGSQQIDNNTLVSHVAPNCESSEIFRGIYSHKSTGVFHGKVHVHPGAEKTRAFQVNKNLLLSDSASANTRPQLEIFADDVKCNHGATVGQLDKNALFYLRSRGIAERDANAMLALAFANENLQQIKNTAIAKLAEQKVLDWMRRNLELGGEI